jgi:hypothetical protein
MNTQVSLSIEQETNRVVKGHELYINGQIEQISNDYEYIVSGKYYVEYFPISETYTCNCADHSFRQVRCKHIISVEFLRIGV